MKRKLWCLKYVMGDYCQVMQDENSPKAIQVHDILKYYYCQEIFISLLDPLDWEGNMIGSFYCWYIFIDVVGFSFSLMQHPIIFWQRVPTFLFFLILVFQYSFSIVFADGWAWPNCECKVYYGNKRAALLQPVGLDWKIEFPMPDRRQKQLVFHVCFICVYLCIYLCRYATLCLYYVKFFIHKHAYILFLFCSCSNVQGLTNL